MAGQLAQVDTRLAEIMIRLHFRNTEFLIEFSFFAVAALVGVLGGTRVFLEMLFACFLHECGHLIAMVCVHRRVRQIRICGAGALIYPADSYGAYGKDVLVLLAGPSVNLAIGIAALYMNTTSLAAWHMALGIFNLLPYAHLDGGGILAALCGMCGVLPEKTIRLQKSVSVLTTLTLFGLLWYFQIKNFSLFCMLFYLQATAFLQE